MSYRVLVVPGFHGSGDAHWQTWVEKELGSAERVRGIDWEQPIVKQWARAITRALDESSVPTVVVAHSFGCLASSVAIASRPHLDLAAVFVAPAHPERFAPFGVRNDPSLPSIAQYLPDRALNVPGVVVASQNDPWMKLQHAYAWADLTPEFRTMNLMRFPVNLPLLRRSQNEEAFFRRTNHQSHQRA